MTDRIAYPGAAGSYTAEAAHALYPLADLYSAGTFADVADDVRGGRADVGVLPIENSLAGLVGDTCDLIADGDLPIHSEAVMHIPHCLCALPGAKVEDVRRIYSNPVALAQCRKLTTDGYELTSTSTTSDAVRTVADSGDWSLAAIASPGAAARYGLEVLTADVSDHPENYTRFIGVRRSGLRPYVASETCRTALRIVTGHNPGALLSAIEPLRYHEVNMVSLHSRPIPGEPWRYQFLIDIEGHAEQPVVARALEDVEARAALVVVLGSYPAAARPTPAPAG
jgi:chorismate mutase/prephenate dehydratase